MTKLTTLDQLKKRILTLASVEEFHTPFVSCYLNLEQGIDEARELFEQRANTLSRIFHGDELSDFEESIDAIRRYLEEELLPEAKGLAFFARSSSDREFYMPLQFGAPLPNLLRVYPAPNIYHLIELKDTYESYVVLIATPSWVRILEVNLGAATIQNWSEQTPVSERVGWEWGETHYQIYQHNRGGTFLQEKISVLQQLMDSRGHSHLILAGNPENTSRIRQALPKSLASKLIDIVPSTEQMPQPDILTPEIVTATLKAFVKYEEQESQSTAERLITAISNHGLAVSGSESCLHMLEQNLVDTLVMLQDYAPDPGWRCSRCNAMGAATPKSQICQYCGVKAVHPTFLREELVRLAESQGCTIEVVEKSDNLAALGGIGCLLRHRPDLQPKPEHKELSNRFV